MDSFHKRQQAEFSTLVHHFHHEMDQTIGRDFENLQLTRASVLRTAIAQLHLKNLITSREEERLGSLSEIIVGGEMDAERVKEIKRALEHLLDDDPGEVARALATTLGAVTRTVEAATHARCI